MEDMFSIMGIIIFSFLAIGLFIILREVFTWYWKINKLIQGQEKTNLLLQQLINYHLYGKLESPEEEKSNWDNDR